jgi:hypothetical protein
MKEFRDEAAESPDKAVSGLSEAPSSKAADVALLARVSAGRTVGASARAAALRLQCSHGNALVARLAGGRLLRKSKLPEERLIRGVGSGLAAEGSAAVYSSPDASSPPSSQLAAGKSVTLLATAGDFYAVEIDGKKAYIRQSELITVVDTPGEQAQTNWDEKFREMSAKLDQDGGRGAPPASGGGTARLDSGGGAFSKAFMDLQRKLALSEKWGALQEEAQHLLRGYAIWYMDNLHGGRTPANLRFLFDYIGRSTYNLAAAQAKYKSVAQFNVSKGTKDWCTQTSTMAVGFVKDQIGGKKETLWKEKAYKEPLRPGDMVFFLWATAQYGGHAVTVIDDLGGSFTHVSGNTGAKAVGIGESKRMTQPPTRSGGEPFDLDKATPAPVKPKDPKDPEQVEAAKQATTKKHKDATEYIQNGGFAWGDRVLVYSITRYG